MAIATSTKSRLEVETQPPFARITLHHPPVNVIDIPMMEELAAALADIEGNDAVSCVVFSGAGKCFSAGVDIDAHTPEQIHSMLAKFHAVIHAVVNSRKVMIAAVRGNCLGGGAELAAVCDMAFTSDTARWGFPEIKLGCYPPVAATILSAVVGQKRAAELILTGRSISGREAAEIGLVNRAVAENELEGAVRETTDQLAKLSPAALALTKKAIYVWDAVHFHKGLAHAESLYLDELMQTEDAQEGINAFLEKRAPVWKGK